MRVSLFAQLVALATVVLAHEEHHIEYSRDELERRDFAMARRHLAARNCASSIDSFTARRKAKRELKADTKPLEQQQQQQQQGQGNTQTQRGRPHGPVKASAISSALASSASARSASASSSSASSASASSASASSAVTSSVVTSSLVSSASAASSSTVSTSTALAADVPAHYTTIQNSTCITAPETTEGPYYINDEIVRTDLREDQTGVTLILDIGVIDINTCEPLSDAFVELWAANATGVYSSYTATLGGGGGSAPSNSSNATMSIMPSGSASGSASAVPSAMPSGSAGGSMSSSALVRNETFLRGGYPTNSQGVVELTTIYPGFYGGRTMHVHTMVHLNYGVNSNGTLASHAGSIIHIGQLFANESWNDAVYNTSPYTTDTNERTYNADDSIYASANTAGYNAEMDITMLGSDISDGLLGYITIGVDSTATYSIANTNYLNSTSA